MSVCTCKLTRQLKYIFNYTQTAHEYSNVNCEASCARCVHSLIFIFLFLLRTPSFYCFSLSLSLSFSLLHITLSFCIVYLQSFFLSLSGFHSPFSSCMGRACTAPGYLPYFTLNIYENIHKDFLYLLLEISKKLTLYRILILLINSRFN